ncbi:MAG: ketoacyl-ACP synthase III [Syntrophomonadaceae bacterium]|nr:ketoacyl-ACP synthase III [Syntrophomonadaceae bacterium]
MTSVVLGIGTAVPEKILTNIELESMVDTTEEWILSRTGIEERRIAACAQATSDLALSASKAALEQGGISADQLDLILVATVTPDMIFPSTACILQRALGAVNAGAFDLSAGCTGFVYALTVAEQFLASGKCRYVLIAAAETLSRITNYEDRNTCILFGDGAGAVVLGRGSKPYGIISAYLGADGNGESLLYVPAGGSRLPASPQTVADNLHYIHMQGNEVFKFAVSVIPECIDRVLNQSGMAMEDVDHFVFHQANRRILQTAVKRLGISWEKVIVNLERYGNVSAASIPLALGEAVEDGRIKEGDLIMMVAFGAGLTMGAVLMRWGGAGND